MKVIKNYLFLLFLIISLVSCSSDDTENGTNNPDNNLNPLEYYQELNVPYGNNSDQVFDIYLPANRTLETEVMILVHGGGWSAGDKNDMNGFKDFLRSEFPNMGIVNINYRLADENNQPYPMQINDITSIINHLKTKQDYYVIDDDFAFIGVSAGAHLSLLWSYAFDVNNNIDMVCSIVGPTNFTDPAYLNNTNPELQILLDLYGLDATTEYLEEVSPYHRVTASAPPTILFYGGLDPLVPTTQGTAMRDKLQDLGVTHEFTLYPNAGHGWIGLDLLDTSFKLKAFIEAHFD
ncbi:alpha/beta hydrolase [Xanthomarina spongicola]|uniref:Acetyl esterase/lipase n=1 Tax=Xanthomarina spongicola TaxID=570520 RepID=A0A316DNC5_9FLAO|nr:alpha/beta hydrolase [Xanthomarina spongicola]PWK19564.1 acetyl esterase/lipase [Xanthomarina spongicola]